MQIHVSSTNGHSYSTPGAYNGDLPQHLVVKRLSRIDESYDLGDFVTSMASGTAGSTNRGSGSRIGSSSIDR